MDDVPHIAQHDLSRFTRAQEEVYPTALAELRSGRKRTHWMWYIFPQVDGLGYSVTTKYYAIKSLEEAWRYLAHPILGARLRECAQALLSIEGCSVTEIFGYPDDVKLKSSMTLFAYVADEPDSLFARVLDKYFAGERDTRTLEILEEMKTRSQHALDLLHNKEEWDIAHGSTRKNTD